ncbi:MAG: sigma 54-interacting transcriptional regulator, partial [Lentisphaerae bacterium]|nr:sigma 54-interacting transcriptional regulator [Lentisphaerota bacterium]
DKPGQFKLASGGTLLLDEIAEMPLALQVKLLRVLNNGEFQPLGSTRALHADARIITSTNRDIDAMVQEGDFREDLYYRINVLTLTIPSLRERLEDLDRLVGFFLERFCNRQGKQILEISAEAMAVLRDYNWPGNIRELENAIEHAIVLCQGERIEVQHLPTRIVGDSPRRVPKSHQSVEPSSEAVIRECLHRNYGDRGKTARELGIHRNTLWRKMREYGIDV